MIGLGYVGLPLTVEFATKYPVVGFDTKTERIEELSRALEIEIDDLTAVIGSTVNGLSFAATAGHIAACNIYIVEIVDGRL